MPDLELRHKKIFFGFIGSAVLCFGLMQLFGPYTLWREGLNLAGAGLGTLGMGYGACAMWTKSVQLALWLALFCLCGLWSVWVGLGAFSLAWHLDQM